MSNDPRTTPLMALAAAEAEFIRAKVELTRAKAAQAGASRSDLIANLKTVRQELRSLRSKFERQKVTVLNLQAECDNIMRAVTVREDQASELLNSRPACFDYLPDDPECVQWSAALEQKRTEISGLRMVLAAQPNLYSLRLEGVELATRIQSLQFSESSLTNQLAGISGKSWGGKAIPESGGTLSGVL
jgi:predicted RNase H-like nuclease (RuvC/YqgF family)